MFKTTFATVVAVFAVSANAAEFHVAPKGADTNPGTQTQPFATLVKARDTAKNGDRVILHGGTYQLDQPLVLTSAHAGVTWTAATGEHPVISGGRSLTGWTLTDPARNLWSAPVGAADDFRQLYIDGKKAVRAGQDAVLRLQWVNGGYRLPAKHPAIPGDLQGAEVIVSNRPWLRQIIPIGKSDKDLLRLPDDFYRRHAGFLKAYPTLTVCRFENHPAFLDVPGEWYLDRTAHAVRYIPRPGEDMTKTTAEIPVLERLVVLEGAEDVAFNGISFRLTNWTAPNAGMCSLQGNQGNFPILGAVDAIGTRNLTVSHCTFRQLGQTGIHFGGGCQRDLVSRCEFTDIASTAVQIGAVVIRDFTTDRWSETKPPLLALPPDSPEIVSDIAVADCLIHRVATDYPSACAIFAGYTRNCRIEHNELHDLPYTGISLGWGWQVENLRADYTSGNRILGNKIYDHMKVLVDGGGIYCVGYQQDGLVKGNLIYGQKQLFGQLYLDDGSENWVVEDNVCHSAAPKVYWILYKDRKNQIRNNFSDTNLVLRRRVRECAFENNTVVPPGTPWPPAAAAIIANAGIRPEKAGDEK